MRYNKGMLRYLAPLAAFGALLVAGCGSGSNVADIGGKVDISQDSYDRWLVTTAKMSSQGGAAPDGPDYKKCIASQRKTVSDKTSASTLKQLCQAQDRALRQQVLQQLVTQGWVLAQADKEGIKANEKAVDQQAKELARQYPKAAGGVNQDDLRTQAESIVLQQQLRAQAGKKKGAKPSEAELRAFYSKKQELFARPATRDVYLLLTNSKADAEAAAAALKGGQSWSSVFSKYNNSRLWNSKTALLQNVSPQSWLPELRKAIFSAPVSQVVGPVSIKPLDAYAVIQVKSSKAGKPAPAFDKSRAQVEQAYLADQAARAGESSIKDLQKTWQPQTNCESQYAKWYPCKGVSAPGK